MIYITERYSELAEAYTVHNVWETKEDNVEELYSTYIHAKAKELGIEINPHCYGMIDWHPQLTEAEYKAKLKEWERRLNIDNFIGNILKGRKLEYKTLYK